MNSLEFFLTCARQFLCQTHTSKVKKIFSPLNWSERHSNFHWTIRAGIFSVSPWPEVRRGGKETRGPYLPNDDAWWTTIWEVQGTSILTCCVVTMLIWLLFVVSCMIVQIVAAKRLLGIFKLLTLLRREEKEEIQKRNKNRGYWELVCQWSYLSNESKSFKITWSDPNDRHITAVSIW